MKDLVPMITPLLRACSSAMKHIHPQPIGWMRAECRASPSGEAGSPYGQRKSLGNIGGRRVHPAAGSRAKRNTNGPLDDIAECRVAGPRQYGFIQFTLRGEAQPDDGDSPCPCRGKGFPEGGYGRVQFPGSILAHPPPFRQRRTVHDETGIKTQTGRRKRKGLFHIFREALRGGAGHTGE